MKNYLLYALGLGALFCHEKVHAQEFSKGAVVSMKADYFKDYEYTVESDGTPGENVKAFNLNITPNSWGLQEVGITDQSFPMNSLTPTEITTKKGVTIVLNGLDSDGTSHDFHSAPLVLIRGNNNVGVVKGYGNKTENIGKDKAADWFLTSGRHGMDLSTAVANVSKTAEVNFGTILLDKEKIADGKPDFLFTQVAKTFSYSPLDQIYFVDAEGNKVGNSVFINFYNSEIPDLGTPQRYMNYYRYGAGPKPLKLLSLEIKDLGIDESNYKTVTSLVYKPSGDSDPAFIAADRNSAFIFKDIAGTINIRGNDFSKEEDVYKIQSDNKSVNIVFNGYSQKGKGPYEFTYEIINGNGEKEEKTITSQTSEISAPVTTDKAGTFIYKLTKVKDLGNNQEKIIKDEEIKIMIEEIQVCTAKTDVNGVPGNTYLAISTTKKDGQEISRLDALGAYMLLESTTKGFIITRNANPERNIKAPKEGMLVWDTTAKCLKLYSNKDGNLAWHCIKKGCNKK